MLSTASGYREAEGRYRVGVGQGGYSYTPVEEPCPLCGVNEENVLMIYRDDGTVEKACLRGDCDMHMVLFKPRPRSGLLNKVKNLFSAESYKPPASAVKAAKKGLAQRKEWGRGGLSPSEAKAQGIDSGVTRARKIASGSVSRHDVRRMSAFNRHRKNNRPDKKMPDGGPTAGTIAWNLWGGTSGVNWAKKKSAAMNAESSTDEFQIMLGTPNRYPGSVKYSDMFNEWADSKQEIDEAAGREWDFGFEAWKAHLFEKFGGGRFVGLEFNAERNAETLDYNTFTNDMEDLLAKYSQLLLTYETEYQSKERGGDGIMEVFMRFKPYNAYFDDVDFDAETCLRSRNP